MPIAIDGALLAEVLPEVLFAEKNEELGLDKAEIGVEAYPDFK